MSGGAAVAVMAGLTLAFVFGYLAGWNAAEAEAEQLADDAEYAIELRTQRLIEAEAEAKVRRGD